MQTLNLKTKIRSRLIKVKNNFKLGRCVTFIIFSIYSFIMLYALVWAVISSLKSHIEFMIKPNDLPEKWLFENYAEAFKLLKVSGNSLFVMLFNTVWYVTGASFISTAVSSMTAYVLARYTFKGRNIMMAVQFGILMIPIYGSTSAGYKLIMDLGIYDSPLYLVKSASAQGQIFFIMMTFFSTLPKAYEEAAIIDGAGHLTVFLRIMIPMAMGPLLSIFILCFIGGWNDYYTAMVYLPSYPTISSGLYIYEKVSQFNMNKPVYFAGIIMCAIPPMILFAIFRDKVMTNVTMGGIKG